MDKRVTFLGLAIILVGIVVSVISITSYNFSLTSCGSNTHNGAILTCNFQDNNLFGYGIMGIIVGAAIIIIGTTRHHVLNSAISHEP